MVETITQYADIIYAAIIGALPAIASIIGVVVAAIKVLGKFKALKNSVDDKTDVTDLKIALNQCLKENAELKKTQRKLLSKLEKIDEADLED